MRKLTLADVTWTLRCEEEHVPVRGNALASGDDAEDRRAENKIIRALERGNQWAWCCVVLTGRYKGLSASDSLGCCSYRNEAEFKQGDYYDDMQANILAELQEQAEELCAALS